MDQAPAAAFISFADAWPRAIETEIGPPYASLGAGKDFDCFADIYKVSSFIIKKFV